MHSINITHRTFRADIVEKASAELRAMPQVGRYACIYSDNPWHHVTRSAKGQTSRAPSRYYDTLSIAEISALPVGELAAKDCHLFMWVTQPHLELSFDVLKAWGFRYSSVHTHWLKLNPKAIDRLFLHERDFSMAMGFTTRKNIEYLVLGRRGAPRRLVKNQRDFIFAARRQHSRKPDESFARVEAYCAGPRAELFSRTHRDGWDVWGNQTDKFKPAPKISGEARGPSAPAPATILFPETPGAEQLERGTLTFGGGR